MTPRPFSRTAAAATGLAREALASRVLRSVTALFLGDGATMALAMLTSVILSRALGADGYGLVRLAQAAVMILMQFMDVRTGEGLIRFMGHALAQEQSRRAVAFFQVGVALDFVVMLVTLGVTALIVPPVLAGHAQGETLRALAAVYLLTVPFAMMDNTFVSLFTLLKRFRLQAALNACSGVCLFVAVGLASGGGPAAVMWGYVIGVGATSLLSVGIALRLFRREVGLPLAGRYGGHRAALKEFLPFAFHTSAMASLKAVSTNLDILLIGALRPVAEVGFFSIARAAAGLIAMPLTPVTTVIYPLLNEAWARRDLARIRHLIARYLALALTIGGAGFVGYLLLADVLVAFIYGSDYLPVGGVIRILTLGIMIEMAAGWIRQAALANGTPALVTFSGTAAFLTRIVTAVPLIFIYGAPGAALAYCAAVLVSVSLNVGYVLPRLGLIRLGRAAPPHAGEK